MKKHQYHHKHFLNYYFHLSIIIFFYYLKLFQNFFFEILIIVLFFAKFSLNIFVMLGKEKKKKIKKILANENI